jgi:hypothetical protein
MALPAAFLGANLPNGFEAAPPGTLLAVAAAAAGAGVAVFARGASAARSPGASPMGAACGAEAARALETVLGCLDELEDRVLRIKGGGAGGGSGGLGRPELEDVLRQALRDKGGPPVPARLDAEVSLVLRIFDADGDHKLSAREWAAREASHDVGSVPEHRPRVLAPPSYIR